MDTIRTRGREADLEEQAHQIQHFSLADLEIDQDEFIDALGGSFVDLREDDYDVRLAQVKLLEGALPEHTRELRPLLCAFYAGELPRCELGPWLARVDAAEAAHFEGFKPFRRRALARFELSLASSGRWQGNDSPASVFRQKPDQGYRSPGSTFDYRQLPRSFATLDSEISRLPIYRSFLRRIATMVHQQDPRVVKMAMAVHHVHNYVFEGNPVASNSPEGIHQDGADYIVSALVVGRYNVVGGVSKVYEGPGGERSLFEAPLAVGEGLFHRERGTSLWHEVTPISRAEGGSATGYRNTIGVDIHTT